MHSNRRKLLTAGAILSSFVLVALWLAANAPEPQRKPPVSQPGLRVETMVVEPASYQYRVSSFGTVQPRTSSLLVAQVSGVIVEVSPVFRDGGFFSRGDILMRIDERDYQTAVKASEAELLQAQLDLEEEQARSRQAQQDWQRLGDGSEAPTLVLRKPQMAAAEARLLSARANYDQALLELERTRIRAPYNGRVRSTQVDLGQYVSSNSQLAEVFATDVVEIRLPLKNSELHLVDLPGNYRGLPQDPDNFPAVTLISDLGGRHEWQGRIVRTEAAIDANSHQLYVVAQIQDPFAIDQSDKTPLKIGQYVTATIEGSTRADALVVPTSSIYQGSYLYLVEGNALQRREVRIGFQNATESVLVSGLEAGSELITSPLGQVTSGTPVRTSNTEQNEQQQAASNRGETP